MNNNPSSAELFGIFDFEEHIVCSPCVLGHRERIVIGGVEGHVEFPSLPALPSKDHLGTFLIPPTAAANWKRGDHLIYWGRVATEPKGVSRVERILFEINVPKANLEIAVKKIHDNFPYWRSLFNEYLELICEQRYEDSIELIGGLSGFDLLVWEGGVSRSPLKVVQNIVWTTRLSESSGFTKEQLKTLCTYCNSLKAPALEYRLQNEAYRALRMKDYRKAIIETAAAAELVLTNAVKPFILSKGENVLNVLNANKMLGKRYKLAQTLGVNLPPHDYQVLLIGPRNEVIHAADFADANIAQTAVNVVADLLALLVPDLGEV